MATTAFVLLVLATLVLLGRRRGPLTAAAVPEAALRGVLVLSRLHDRRRERLRPRPAAAAAREDRATSSC
jgi:hypothetical protein